VAGFDRTVLLVCVGIGGWKIGITGCFAPDSAFMAIVTTKPLKYRRQKPAKLSKSLAAAI